jgi:hypothetical protein
VRQRTTPDGSTRESDENLSANADTGKIVAAELTTNDVDDGSQSGRCSIERRVQSLHSPAMGLTTETTFMVQLLSVTLVLR